VAARRPRLADPAPEAALLADPPGGLGRGAAAAGPRGDDAIAGKTAERSEPGPEERVVDLEEARRRLRALKADQRTAIGLQAAGLTYLEIGERRGWTYTKVNRSITEGRTALREAA
jgi:DNA-directed RNA polymerase specialized sigma24 family protein